MVSFYLKRKHYVHAKRRHRTFIWLHLRADKNYNKTIVHYLISYP